MRFPKKFDLISVAGLKACIYIRPAPPPTSRPRPSFFRPAPALQTSSSFNVDIQLRSSRETANALLFSFFFFKSFVLCGNGCKNKTKKRKALPDDLTRLTVHAHYVIYMQLVCESLHCRTLTCCGFSLFIRCRSLYDNNIPTMLNGTFDSLRNIQTLYDKRRISSV